ncbi:short-chain dehydrogenase, partial [bacterium]|nr:short-chain dehydrogenase [bacterium]
HLLRKTARTFQTVLSQSASELSQITEALIRSDANLRASVLSIGIPILLSDGQTLLRGPEVKIPPYSGTDVFDVTPEAVDHWAHNGWLDLREANMELWRQRVQTYLENGQKANAEDTSSNFPWGRFAADASEEIHPGKMVVHIFIDEEKGDRIKR